MSETSEEAFRWTAFELFVRKFALPRAPEHEAPINPNYSVSEETRDSAAAGEVGRVVENEQDSHGVQPISDENSGADCFCNREIILWPVRARPWSSILELSREERPGNGKTHLETRLHLNPTDRQDCSFPKLSRGQTSSRRIRHGFGRVDEVETKRVKENERKPRNERAAMLPSRLVVRSDVL